MSRNDSTFHGALRRVASNSVRKHLTNADIRDDLLESIDLTECAEELFDVLINELQKEYMRRVAAELDLGYEQQIAN